MIYFLTPVWGKEYVKLYLDVTIPAQLSAQNLPVFAAEKGTKYFIYTTPDDMRVIKSSQVFNQLNAIVQAVFEPVDTSITITHDRMSDCFRRGIDAANAAGAATVFLTPDIVFANGAFATIKRLAKIGHDVIYIPAIRTLKNGTAEALCNHFADGQTIHVGPRDLMQVALDNLHPLAHLSWWDEREVDLLPANLYWRVGNEGILGRCFHLHPLFVRPQRKNIKFFGTVDDDYCLAACPDASKDYVVTDSDELFAVELSDPTRYFRTGFRKGSIEDATTWAQQFANKRHRLLFDHAIRMHTGIKNEKIWNQVAHESDIVAASIKSNLATLPIGPMSSRSWLRHLIRVAQDQRLEIANEPVSDRKNYLRRIFDKFKSWPIWFLTTYKNAIRFILALRKFYLGSSENPRMYTSRFLVQFIVRLDIRQIVGSLAGAVLISEDPGASYLRSIALKENHDLAVATFVESERESGFVLHRTGERIKPGRYDLILLEQGHIADLDKLIDLAYNVLPQGGLLAIFLVKGFGPTKPSWNNHIAQREPFEKVLRPKFHILDFRTQGGIGSALKLKYAYRLGVILRRRPILARLMELTIIWLPLYVLLGSLFNISALIFDSLDRKKGDGISSFMLAGKSDDCT